jgi:tRNA threonylcarbamoyladenosine biosynthesis protein TsaB
MILAIRTDKPIAELYLIRNGEIIANYSYQADRKLADSLLDKIESFFAKNKCTYKSLEGICVYSGSGSFTGLRIGTAVANSLAYSLNIKVVKSSGENWLDNLQRKVDQAKPNRFVYPDYDKEPNITMPKSKRLA